MDYQQQFNKYRDRLTLSPMFRIIVIIVVIIVVLIHLCDTRPQKQKILRPEGKTHGKFERKKNIINKDSSLVNSVISKYRFFSFLRSKNFFFLSLLSFVVCCVCLHVYTYTYICLSIIFFFFVFVVSLSLSLLFRVPIDQDLYSNWSVVKFVFFSFFALSILLSKKILKLNKTTTTT